MRPAPLQPAIRPIPATAPAPPPGRRGPSPMAARWCPTAALPNYLMPGPAGFVTVDFPAFAQATNYEYYHDNEPETGGSNTGASGGMIREVVKSAFATVNGEQELGGNTLRFNVGVRYVNTIQTISGRVSLPDPRNTTAVGRIAARRQPLSQHRQHRVDPQSLRQVAARCDVRLRRGRSCGGPSGRHRAR